MPNPWLTVYSNECAKLYNSLHSLANQLFPDPLRRREVPDNKHYVMLIPGKPRTRTRGKKPSEPTGPGLSTRNAYQGQGYSNSYSNARPNAGGSLRDTLYPSNGASPPSLPAKIQLDLSLYSYIPTQSPGANKQLALSLYSYSLNGLLAVRVTRTKFRSVLRTRSTIFPTLWLNYPGEEYLFPFLHFGLRPEESPFLLFGFSPGGFTPFNITPFPRYPFPVTRFQ